jgi:hypothetical protein
MNAEVTANDYIEMDESAIIEGDSLAGARKLPDGSIQCVIRAYP